MAIRTATLVAAILAILPAAQAQTDAPPPAAGNRVTVTPGYSIAVPKGWMACDPAVNAQIGGPPLPEFFSKDMCGDPPKDMALPLVKSEPGGFGAVMVGVDTASVAPLGSRPITDSELQELKDKLCHMKFLSSQNLTRCDLQVSTVAGQQAVTGVLLSPGDGGLAMKMQIAVIPKAEAGMVMFLFVHAALGTAPDKFGEDPDVDTMIASLAKE